MRAALQSCTCERKNDYHLVYLVAPRQHGLQPVDEDFRVQRTFGVQTERVDHAAARIDNARNAVVCRPHERPAGLRSTDLRLTEVLVRAWSGAEPASLVTFRIRSDAAT